MTFVFVITLVCLGCGSRQPRVVGETEEWTFEKYEQANAQNDAVTPPSKSSNPTQ